MKVTFKLDSGPEITTGPESVVVQGLTNDKKEAVVAIGYKTEQGVVPVLFFAGHYFSAEAMAAHDKEVLKARKNGNTTAQQ